MEPVKGIVFYFGRRVSIFVMKTDDLGFKKRLYYSIEISHNYFLVIERELFDELFDTSVFFSGRALITENKVDPSSYFVVDIELLRQFLFRYSIGSWKECFFIDYILLCLMNECLNAE